MTVVGERPTESLDHRPYGYGYFLAGGDPNGFESNLRDSGEQCQFHVIARCFQIDIRSDNGPGGGL